jgi:hypothetical protein
MKITKPEKDVIIVDEQNIDKYQNDNKFHLIKMSFRSPSDKKIMKVLDTSPHTNRYIISDNIRVYNNILKSTSKKYYVQNNDSNDFITFLRKNNKILLSLPVLSREVKNFVTSDYVFSDILKNIEVIMMTEYDYTEFEYLLKRWDGNIIIVNENIHTRYLQ